MFYCFTNLEDLPDPFSYGNDLDTLKFVVVDNHRLTIHLSQYEV